MSIIFLLANQFLENVFIKIKHKRKGFYLQLKIPVEICVCSRKSLQTDLFAFYKTPKCFSLFGYEENMLPEIKPGLVQPS